MQYGFLTSRGLQVEGTEQQRTLVTKEERHLHHLQNNHDEIILMHATKAWSASVLNSLD
jgi:hypothetical protein